MNLRVLISPKLLNEIKESINSSNKNHLVFKSFLKSYLFILEDIFTKPKSLKNQSKMHPSL